MLVGIDGFNPTLVRLARCVSERKKAGAPGFNPTLVRLARLEVGGRGVGKVVSIPPWFD